MNPAVDPVFRDICGRIVRESYSESEWAELESDDWCQIYLYEGGFDATESAFCFSCRDPNGDEWWFQVSLGEVGRIAEGEALKIQARRQK